MTSHVLLYVSDSLQSSSLSIFFNILKQGPRVVFIFVYIGLNNLYTLARTDFFP